MQGTDDMIFKGLKAAVQTKWSGDHKKSGIRATSFTIFRSLGTTPISGRTLSEWKGHSWSSWRVPGNTRSSSRNWKFHSWNTKCHSRNGIPRLEQHEHHNSRSNSRSDILKLMGTHMKDFICPSILRAFFKNWGGPRAPDIWKTVWRPRSPTGALIMCWRGRCMALRRLSATLGSQHPSANNVKSSATSNCRIWKEISRA